MFLVNKVNFDFISFIRYEIYPFEQAYTYNYCFVIILNHVRMLKLFLRGKYAMKREINAGINKLWYTSKIKEKR